MALKPKMTLSLDDIAEDCIKAARFAGDHLERHFGSAVITEKVPLEMVPQGVDPKTFSAVTKEDFFLQREIAIMLLSKYPDFEFFGEEDPIKVFDPLRDSALLHKIQTNRSRYQWVVDPLDGTAKYGSRDARYGVNIGLLEDNNFVVSVTYSPSQGLLTSAIRGNGTYRNGKKFVFDSVVNDHVIINSKADLNAALKQELQEHGLFMMRPKHTGSMYDMLLMQYAPFMVSLKTNTHDHPMSLGVEEAGGAALVYDGRNFVDSRHFDWRRPESKKDAHIPAYIAANSMAKAEFLRDIVQKHFKAAAG